MPINSLHPEYDRKMSDVTNDAFNGNVCDYIPRLVGQSNEEYRRYVERAAYLNIVGRTASALIGVMLRKPYRTNADTDEINIAGGIGFDEFLTEIITSLMLCGRMGVRVEFFETIKQTLLIY